MSALLCWNCGAGLAEVPLPLSRHANCPACYAHLHCCNLCQHFDPKRPAQCTEDRAEPPNNKETANFCEWFAPRSTNASATHGAAAADSARAKLDALFTRPAQFVTPSQRSAASDAGSTADQATPAAGDPAGAAPKPSGGPSPAERAHAELERLFGAARKDPPTR